MAEEEDGGFVWPDEDGADEDLKVVHHVLVPVGWVSLDAKGRKRTVKEKDGILKGSFNCEKLKDKGERQMRGGH